MNAAQITQRNYARRYFTKILKRLENIYEAYHEQEIEPYYDKEFNYFEDGVRKIDMILVYRTSNKPHVKYKVNQFLHLLENEGFQFEGHDSKMYPDLLFIKTFCPRHVLLNAAAILNIHLSFLSNVEWHSDYSSFFNFDFLFNDLTKPTPKTDVAQRAYESTFNLKPSSMTSAERCLIVIEMMKNCKYTDGDHEQNVLDLLHDKSLEALYPLHDGLPRWTSEGSLNDRQLLYRFWASQTNVLKLQPIDLVHKYFGSEIAFYFAFLGFYNKMLIPMVFLGFLAFLYGIMTYNDSRNYVSVGICNSDITLCPDCPDVEICQYHKLNENCFSSKVNYIFDNPAVYLFVIFMSLWTTIIEVSWKRRQIVLIYKWDLMYLESGYTVRPEYTARWIKAKLRRDLKGQSYKKLSEPIWLRSARYFASTITVMLMAAIIFALIVIFIVFRLQMNGKFSKGTSQFDKKMAISTIIHTVLLIIICLAEMSFLWLARFVTDFENPKTQEEYDRSVVYKYYFLTFFTTFSFLFYTAFFRGRFATYPGDIAQYNMYLSYDKIGVYNICLLLSHQWTTLLLGKEVLTRLFYHIYIWITKLYRRRDYDKKYVKSNRPKGWEIAYGLIRDNGTFMVVEHMRLAMQYGFLFIFSGAQPMGPLIAFVYNCFLLRINANDLTVQGRRPIPKRQPGMGAWTKILKFNSYIGMITNSFYLAFSTDLVPYIGKHFNPFQYRTNYLNYTFSEFSIDDFGDGFDARNREGREGTSCYYRAQRHGPRSARKYQFRIEHWNQYSLQFAAVIILQAIFFIFNRVFNWFVSDVPLPIKERLNYNKRMENLAKERAAAHRMPPTTPTHQQDPSSGTPTRAAHKAEVNRTIRNVFHPTNKKQM